MGYKKVQKVIICEGCGKPILNSRTANAKTHTGRIKGIKSKCQELRDRKYNEILRKKNRHLLKMPLNKSTQKSVMRTCLGPKCQGKKKFLSISIYQRQCNYCYNNGFDRAAVKIGFK
jgi:hypothetical protein